ncbi:MAG: hypothetical protein ABIH67_01860 [Candidatus Uhrbacteria bacterium]|nr:hypothetical protein [Patescibacteria group bacterium]MBU1906955.1 hypothetical protein [Patescibacteria group bacterium]
MISNDNNKKIHLIYIADDGVASFYCGVGAMTKNFIFAFPEIADRLASQGITAKLSVISIKPTPGAIGKNDKLLSDVKKVCQASGGQVALITSQRQPKDDYFNFEVWEEYNRQAKKTVKNMLATEDSLTIIIAVDTVFAQIYLSHPNLVNVWIPHSLTQVHEQTYVNGQERVSWEQKAALRIIQDEQSYVGSISPHVSTMLQRLFSFPQAKQLSFHNGFYFPLLKKYEINATAAKTAAAARGIDSRHDIILSFGRSDEYKGLDLSLQAMIEVTEKYPLQGVLIASRFSDETIVRETQRRLAKLAVGKESRVKLFLGFEYDLPKQLLCHPKTKFLLHLPTKDFCPLIPHEAELIGHDDLCVINSNIPCLKGKIKDITDGFLCAAAPSAAADKIETIMSLKPSQKQRVIEKAKQRAAREMNIVDNYLRGLTTIINKHL